MKILLNNRIEEFDVESMSISELIIRKNYTFRMLVTKINNVLVKKEDRVLSYIIDGDEVVVIHMISGG